jgi:hypothetical protein
MRGYYWGRMLKVLHERFPQRHHAYQVPQALTHRPTFVLHDFQQGSRNGVHNGGLHVIVVMKVLTTHPKALIDRRARDPLSSDSAKGPVGAEGSIKAEGPPQPKQKAPE